jgi:hypothetical protein
VSAVGPLVAFYDFFERNGEAQRKLKHLPPYYKTWYKGSLGLKVMLSLLFAKRLTVTASVLNQD